MKKIILSASLFSLAAFADVTAPDDVFDCPADTKSYELKASDGVPPVQEGVITCAKRNGPTAGTVVKTIYKPSQNSTILINSSPGSDLFMDDLFAAATEKVGLKRGENAYWYNYNGYQHSGYSYSVDKDNKKILQPIYLLSGMFKYLSLHLSSDPELTMVASSFCNSVENGQTHIDAPGLTVRRIEKGFRSRVVPNGNGAQSFMGYAMCSGSGGNEDDVGPFSSTLSCESSGKKIEFIFKVPKSEWGESPVFLGLVVNGNEIFWKKLSDQHPASKDLYVLANPLRPKFLKTPLDIALDAAFDCFDHLIWREKGDAKEKAGFGDRYDAKGIATDVRGVEAPNGEKFNSETNKNLAEIAVLMKRDQVSFDSPHEKARSKKKK